jgi:hypothetical protein
MDPISLAVLAVVLLFALAVGLSVMWWMIKSAVKTMVKLAVFAVATVVVVSAVAAGVVFFVAH